MVKKNKILDAVCVCGTKMIHPKSNQINETYICPNPVCVNYVEDIELGRVVFGGGVHDKEDNIRQQKHYTQHAIQPVVFIGMNKIDFLAGNVIKYVSRYNMKNGVEDLKKAQHYLDMLIQREEKGSIVP